MDFHFTNDRPIYLQLIEQLERYIIAGQFSPGERLPSVREFATIAKANPNTIQRALQELEDKRLIITKRTNGKFVTDDADFIVQLKLKFARQKIDIFLREMHELGFANPEIINQLQNFKRKD